MIKYDDRFYGDNSTRLESSREILKFIFEILNPKSILDVGCGRGAWLKSSRELGAKTLYGFDGEWNDGKEIDNEIIFKSIDLNKNFNVDKKFDLTLCLEVAEHLEKNSSEIIISSLTKSSNAILFSSAFKHQGGIGHLNENLHSFWAKLFFKYDFLPYDIIRPQFWNNKKISYWYRQNSFLYIKKNSTEFDKLSKNYKHLQNFELMDSIHPEMFFKIVGSQGIRYHLRQIFYKIKKKFL